jgi:hypothetical protein
MVSGADACTWAGNSSWLFFKIEQLAHDAMAVIELIIVNIFLEKQHIKCCSYL